MGTIKDDKQGRQASRPLWQKLAWFAALWLAGTLAILVTASLLHLLIPH